MSDSRTASPSVSTAAGDAAHLIHQDVGLLTARSPASRVEQLFERVCDDLSARGQDRRVAVDAGSDGKCTYDQLDADANRLARHLLHSGLSSGDRVGLLFDRWMPCYAAMLAVLKLPAAYVPLDAALSRERLAVLCADAGVHVVLTESHLSPQLADSPVHIVCLDERRRAVATELSARLASWEHYEPVDSLCYIDFTSAHTGQPGAVLVDHSAVCNSVRVATPVGDTSSGGRVHHRAPMSFAHSVRDIWIPWMTGTTLVSTSCSS